MLKKITDSIDELIFEPFRHGPDIIKRLLLGLLASQTLVALSYSTIPLLFYQPLFYCTDKDGNLFQCEETMSCKEPGPVKYKSEYGFGSITLDFQLFCGRRILQANILTVCMAGHLASSIVATYLAKYAHSSRNVILIMIYGNLLCALGLISSIICYTPNSVAAMLFVWSLGMDIVNSYTNVIPIKFYPRNMAKKVVGVQIAAWPCYSIFIPIIYGLIKDWRLFLVLCAGIPHLIVAYYMYKDLDQLSVFKVDEVEDVALDSKHDLQAQIIQGETGTPQKQVTKAVIARHSGRISGAQAKGEEVSPEGEQVTFAQIWNSPYFRNMLAFFFVFGGSYVAAFSSMVNLNTLSGNIYVNLTFLTIIQMALSLSGNFISHYFDVTKSLFNIYFSMGVLYTLFMILPPFLKYLVILQGKLLTDMTWVLLIGYSHKILPHHVLPFAFSVRSLYNLSLYTVLPYVRFYMQLAGYSIFLFSGIYQLLVALTLWKIQ